MILVFLIAGVGVVSLLAWRIRPKRAYTPDPDDPLDDGSTAPIDHEELERAEREVRELGVSADPDAERPEDDWGPGTRQR